MSSVVIEITAQSPLASAGWFTHGPEWAGDPDEEAFALPVVIATIQGRWRFHGHHGRVDADGSNLVLGHPGETYRCGHDEREPIPTDRTFSVTVDPEVLDHRLPPTSELPRTTPVDVLLASLSRPVPQALRFEAVVVELLARLGQIEAPGGYVSSAQRRAVLAAREWLQTSLGRDVTLLELASEVHLSPFHVHRLFRSVVGVPPHEFVTRARMRLALELLAEGCSVTEVAMAVGYSTPSGFSSAFKRRVGVSPSRYRP
jgi:AraC-like DNA-binding protein